MHNTRYTTLNTCKRGGISHETFKYPITSYSHWSIPTAIPIPMDITQKSHSVGFPWELCERENYDLFLASVSKWRPIWRTALDVDDENRAHSAAVRLK